DGFYAAVEDGPDAELEWIAADGTRTHDPEVVYGEVFSHARRGLAASGVDERTVDWLLEPIRKRHLVGVTPGTWKRDRALERIGDGETISEAIRGATREYLRRSASSESFGDWI
ncbi:MAG: hypothetical protein ACOCZD_02050, partial [Haloferacaceae archaeon]